MVTALPSVTMKRKIFDLRPWPRVTRSTQTVTAIPGFVIVDFMAQGVIRPLDVPIPQAAGAVRILDSGFRWVRCHPTGSGEGVMGASLTVQLNAAGRPVQFYVDIHGGEGIGEGGLPWHDDLYLDVIGKPGEHDPWTVEATEIIDADELDEAVQTGLVSPSLAEATWTHARHIETVLKAGTFAPVQVLKTYLSDPYT